MLTSPADTGLNRRSVTLRSPSTFNATTCRRYSDEPFEPDRAFTLFADTEVFVVQVGQRSSERCSITDGLTVQRTHLRPLERDRRTFRVMLVVGVRHFSSCDDVVELPGE